MWDLTQHFISLVQSGAIQLLHSHLGGRGGGPSKCEHMRTGGGGVTSMRMFVYKFFN